MSRPKHRPQFPTAAARTPVARPRAAGGARDPSLSERARYAFDSTMARGPIALVAWLAIVTLILIAVFSVIVLATGMESGRDTVAGQLFWALMHALDPGTVAGDEGTWQYLATMLVLTIAGLFVVSALIGVIATALDQRLADLRKGRSRVLEREHTLILGWSDAVIPILHELAIANESRRRPAVVILAERDKVEMDDEIREKAGDLNGTRVVCRSGSPIDLDDLEIVNHQTARSIIVLAPPGADPDAEVIKTIIALTRGPNRREAPYHIVAEIQEPENLEAARLVAGEEAVIIDKGETVARLIVQTSRQSGASAVYVELFDFDGDEVYFRDDPALAGKTYGDALLAYESCAVIGLAQNGTVALNPPADTPIDGASVVAIARDDDDLEQARPVLVAPDEAAISAGVRAPQGPSRILVLGWNARAARVVAELDNYALPGSALDIHHALGEPQLPPLENLRASARVASTTDRATLAALDVAAYDQIIVLCYSDDLDAQRADAKSLITLLHLRELIAADPQARRPAIVSEMLDDRNRALAQVAEVDDVIVSDKILSLILAQISEDARLDAVFRDLLDADGSEIYLRPATDYVRPGGEVSFATIVAAARRRGETAIGYRVAGDARDAEAGFGVRVNPGKSELFVPAADDRVVVLAED